MSDPVLAPLDEGIGSDELEPGRYADAQRANAPFEARRSALERLADVRPGGDLGHPNGTFGSGLTDGELASLVARAGGADYVVRSLNLTAAEAARLRVLPPVEADAPPPSPYTVESFADRELPGPRATGGASFDLRGRLGLPKLPNWLLWLLVAAGVLVLSES